MKTEQIFILLGFSKLQKNILEVIKNFKSEIIIFDKKKITEDVRSYKIDCSDTDKVLKKLRDLEPILELKKKRIISYCGSEFGLHTASKINKFYNSKFLSSFENSKKFLEKEYSGNFFKKLNLNIPRRLTFKQGLERLKNNQLVIIKPAKQSGSIGVNLIKKKDVFKNTFKKLKKKYKKIICEEYVEGNGIDIQGYVKDNNLYKLGLGDRYFSDGQFKIPIFGNYPSMKNTKIQNKAYKILEKIIKKTNFNNSFIKGDVLLNKMNELYLLEVAPRLHGDVFSTNTLYYNNKILSPLNIFFRYCFGQSSIKDIKKNKRLITVWHSIFFKKKMSKITLKQFKDKINKLYKTHNIFIKNKIAFRKIHKDNTSISGFFWFSVKPENFQKSLKSIHKNFSNVIEVKKI